MADQGADSGRNASLIDVTGVVISSYQASEALCHLRTALHCNLIQHGGGRGDLRDFASAYGAPDHRPFYEAGSFANVTCRVQRGGGRGKLATRTASGNVVYFVDDSPRMTFAVSNPANLKKRLHRSIAGR